jgi:anaphase-promoting complex subunit 5
MSRGDLVGAQHFLQQIQANPPPDQDLAFTSAVLEINFQIRRANYSEAMALVEKHSAKIHAREGDIFQRLKLMILKARIYDKAGAPQKGFSVAMRAASLAHKARILPSLWEAVGAVCRVLLSLGEFEAATKLLRAIIPQVLECEDCELTANMFACLADAHMGMAGEIRSDELKCKEQMTKTLEYLGRAFDEYSRIHDVKGQCEMMTKKSMVMHLNGDLLLANDYASKYLDIQRAAKEELAS